ncbi:MAG TPA: HEAT repeat domain-containing protein, partial [Candidatus Polarisedimenticolia bacterium]|nr:HEAT repeat domain-containing protein [Candidatus Polarisedimenticolia bacterium]
MLENVFKENPAPEPSGRPREKPRRSPLPALLFVPLLLLCLLGLIIYLFGWLSFDRRDALDLVEEVRAAQGERRALVAYELSRLERYDLDDASRPRFLAVAEGLLSNPQETDPRVKRSLALTLGRIHESSSVATLRAAAADPDPETQIYALWSLGAIGDPAAGETLAAALQSEDAAVR